MDGSSSAPLPHDLSNFPAGSGGGASRLLADLPSRGNFSSTVLSINPKGMRVYLCHHDTSSPENQIIRTNQTNILIRSLMLQKGNPSSKDGKSTCANQSSRKRASEKALDDKAAGKKSMSSTKLCSSHDLQSLTVERLRVLLRENGLSSKGRKDELIARLRCVNG